MQQNTQNTDRNTQQQGPVINIADPVPNEIGPFNRGELEGLTRIAVKSQGLSWGDLDPKEQRVYLHLAEGAITRRQVTGIEPVVDTTSGLPKMYEAFQTLLLKEARTSQKWNEQDYDRGFSKTKFTTEDARA